MTSKLTYLVALTFILLTSCTSDLALLSEVTVIDHSNCDSQEAAVIHLSAIEGNGPFFYEVFDVNNRSVFSEVSEDRTITIELENLSNIDYTYKVIDQNMDVSEGAFQVIPTGKSSIRSTVKLKGSLNIGAVYDTKVNLYIDNGELTLVETQTTDSEGNYSFENLAAGYYAIEINLPSKYDEYRMEVFNREGHSLMKAGTNRTESIPISCLEALDLKVLFKK